MIHYLYLIRTDDNIPVELFFKYNFSDFLQPRSNAAQNTPSAPCKNLQSKNVSEVNPSLTAVGWFIRAVHAVIVTVAHPDTGNAALSDDTLELVGCACHLSYINITQVRVSSTNHSNAPTRDRFMN